MCVCVCVLIPPVIICFIHACVHRYLKVHTSFVSSLFVHIVDCAYACVAFVRNLTGIREWRMLVTLGSGCEGITHSLVFMSVSSQANPWKRKSRI